jgi:hypothetical protein
MAASQFKAVLPAMRARTFSVQLDQVCFGDQIQFVGKRIRECLGTTQTANCKQQVYSLFCSGRFACRYDRFYRLLRFHEEKGNRLALRFREIDVGVCGRADGEEFYIVRNGVVAPGASKGS